MRLLTLLSPALLAANAFASESESATSSSSVSSASSSSSSAASSSSSSSSSSSAIPEPTPVGEIWSPKWKDSDLSSYTKKCQNKAIFNAEIYRLGELYPTLKDFAPELKVFYNKQLYPGSWGGVDKHGNERELLKMGLEELPFGVREWLQRNPTQRRFSMQEDVVFFAPGAIYPIMPLWVDEPETEAGSVGSDCEGLFEDLENYSTEPKDGAVLARLEHTRKEKNEIEFTIEAFQVKKAEQSRDEL
ncbi:hypothetical protein CC78DRAFT_574322 [Lojkania enalia]|uniref:Uncharacterized protein n=1 Tax=Lojkania enalia TaxID=147567 RepID=A0A9P4NBN2_9PLEO|nr:hypothetical protein CC78DRAFT_574322 [Didymosphaeria enalia]